MRQEVSRSPKIEQRKWGEEINGTAQENGWHFHVERSHEVHAKQHEKTNPDEGTLLKKRKNTGAQTDDPMFPEFPQTENRSHKRIKNENAFLLLRKYWKLESNTTNPFKF